MWSNILRSLNSARLWVGEAAVNVYNHPSFWRWLGNLGKVVLFAYILYDAYLCRVEILTVILEVAILVWITDWVITVTKKAAGQKKVKHIIGPWLRKWVWWAIARYVVWTFTWRGVTQAEECDEDETLEIY